MKNLSDLYFRKLKLEDVYTFKNWKKHESVLFYDYNFMEETEEDIKNWFKWKTEVPFTEYYAIIYKESPIGYMSLKNINKILKTATIGIAMDPNYIDYGLGSLILEKFLDYLRDENFKIIYLNVALYNKRAIKVYKKLGFKIKYKFVMKFNNGEYDEKNADFYNNRDSFKRMLNRTFFYVYKMEKKL